MRFDASVKKALLFWSSGKDSAYALHLLRRRGGVEVVGLITTVNRSVRRISVHAVREKLLAAQARACGLPVRRLPLPDPCSNAHYEAVVGNALAEARRRGIAAVIFGDLHLQDIRAYREQLLAGTGIEALFPLWGRDTAALAAEVVNARLRASFAGRDYDQQFLADLPPAVDHCGENGEFHTFVYDGPMFRHPVALRAGRVSQHGGFAYADFLPEA